MVWFLKKNCKKALYLALYFNPGLKNFHQFLYLKLCSENFYGNFQCLKVFELNLKLCWYNSFWEAGVNRRWSKHRFHPSVYGLSCLEKTWRCHLRKNLKKNLAERKTLMKNGEWLFLTGYRPVCNPWVCKGNIYLGDKIFLCIFISTLNFYTGN